MKIDEQIYVIDKIIERHIAENAQKEDFGFHSQAIIKEIRDLAEAVTVRLHKQRGDIEYDYDDIRAAKPVLNNKANRFIKDLLHSIQIIGSHNTICEECAEFMMSKYLGYLIKLRDFVCKNFGINIMSNVATFIPEHKDNYSIYYDAIAKKIFGGKDGALTTKEYKYYPVSCKPIFTKFGEIYEIVLATSHGEKYGNIIAFSNIEVPFLYGIKVELAESAIKLEKQTNIMPIYIVTNFNVSITSKEINLLFRMFGKKVERKIIEAVRTVVNSYINSNCSSLLEIIISDDCIFQKFIENVARVGNDNEITHIYKRIREIIVSKCPGQNILRYALHNLSSDYLEKQIGSSPNQYLSGLYVSSKSAPFDAMPFCTSLAQHNVPMAILLDCIPCSEREHEFLAKKLEMRAENDSIIFTNISELGTFGNKNEILDLIAKYNNEVKKYHPHREILKHAGDNFYIKQYADTTAEIINKLIIRTQTRIERYEELVDEFLLNHTIDPIKISDEKIELLKKLFSNTCLAVLTGAAGTGKTKFISLFSSIFNEYPKLFIANTTPAVENIRSQCKIGQYDTCCTVAKFLANINTLNKEFSFLIVDEARTISNRDILKVLSSVHCVAILIVGDPFQLGSIQFGNWFGLAKYYLPNNAYRELRTVHRTTANSLLALWNSVRFLQSDFVERIGKGHFISKLDDSIFHRKSNDEILLALNYNGLYGINNINMFMQANNPGRGVRFHASEYKVNDPIIFKENKRFAPHLYNNLKGIILDISEYEDHIDFTLEVNRVIISMLSQMNFTVLGSNRAGTTIILLSVFKPVGDVDYSDERCIVPFHVSYAVSFHKAQGLEFESVKVLISDENEENVTHDVFYTAITRSTRDLKIFWSPERAQVLMDKFCRDDLCRDFYLLANLKNLPVARTP